MIINSNLGLMENYNLISLGNLQIVHGDLNLFGCKNLKDLGKLKVVKEDLNLNDCKNLEDLENLQSAELLFLEGTKITKEYIKKEKPWLLYKCLWNLSRWDHDNEGYEI